METRMMPEVGLKSVNSEVILKAKRLENPAALPGSDTSNRLNERVDRESHAVLGSQSAATARVSGSFVDIRA